MTPDPPPDDPFRPYADELRRHFDETFAGANLELKRDIDKRFLNITLTLVGVIVAGFGTTILVNEHRMSSVGDGIGTRLTQLEQRLDNRIGGAEQRLETRINSVEQRLDNRITGVDQRVDNLLVSILRPQQGTATAGLTDFQAVLAATEPMPLDERTSFSFAAVLRKDQEQQTGYFLILPNTADANVLNSLFGDAVRQPGVDARPLHDLPWWTGALGRQLTVPNLIDDQASFVVKRGFDIFSKVLSDSLTRKVFPLIETIPRTLQGQKFTSLNQLPQELRLVESQLRGFKHGRTK